MPILPAEPDPQQLNLLAAHAINDQVWGLAHDPLARVPDLAGSADVGMLQQTACGIVNTLRRRLSGEQVIFGDVVLGFEKIRQRPARPAQFQTLTPQ